MSRDPFARRWLLRSLRGTLAAGAVATLSLALSAALVFALVAVRRGVGEQLGRELASYGANLLVLPASTPLRFGLGALELDAQRCITFHDKPCGVCATVCPIGDKALAMDEAGHPVIRVEGCVGCGICVRACVTIPSSLELRPVEA